MDEAEVVVDTLRNGRLIHEDRSWRRRQPPIFEEEWQRLIARVSPKHPELVKFDGFGAACCGKLKRVGIAQYAPPFAEGFETRHICTSWVCRTCGRVFTHSDYYHER